MKKFGYLNLLNYIDDLIYLGMPSNTESSYTFLLQLLQDLGLEIYKNQACGAVYICCLSGYTSQFG